MNIEYLTREREEGRSLSRAVKVKGGITVYLSGMLNRDAEGKPAGGDFETQTRGAFEQIRNVMELAGGTMDDIVNMTVFITDSRYHDEFVRIRSEYFKPGHYPASTMIIPAALANPNVMVEIQAIAVLDEGADFSKSY